MSNDTETATQAWPLGVKLNLLGMPAPVGVIEVRPGLTTLVGPNGSGKTRALRAIKAALEGTNYVGIHGRKVHFLAAGRTSPLEPYRSSSDTPNGINHQDAAVGNSVWRDQWWNFESITGSLMALDDRADLRLKVEARLQQLFDRSVRLSWSQHGLTVRLAPISGGAAYAANSEASGILQLVGLLAAIHNDQIGALLIDEPEISLHPQHQAFLLEEMEKVAGDPADLERKLIVIATHSASLLPLHRISDLPSIAFFNAPTRPPAQVSQGDAILSRAKLAGLVARLGSTHRLAMFANRVLFVEGPSDEIITTQLARRLDMRLLARNSQVLPVTGKGEFIEAAKLFGLMNKRVTVLADLDALADDNSLVRHFSDLPEALFVAERLGRKRLTDLDQELRSALDNFMTAHQGAVDAAAAAYPDWSSKSASALAPRRVTLARLLTDPASFGGDAGSKASGVKTRYEALLKALAELGCFFLRRGAIENYYRKPTADHGKPELAANEAGDFETWTVDDLQSQYADVLSALTHVAPNHYVDEDQLLRPKLGAILTAAFLGMKNETPDGELGAIAKATIGSDAEIFSLKNRSGAELRLEVDIASRLFKRDAFPFEIGREENPTVITPRKLPGAKPGAP